MHPLFHLFTASDSLHYPGIFAHRTRAFAWPAKRLLLIPDTTPPVRMRVTPELFAYVQTMPDWHLRVSRRLFEHLALVCGRQVAQHWLQRVSERHAAGLVPDAPAAREVTHG
ncbi:MAG: hypothetical protein M3R45_11225 [Pseudomonadota bacterium]|nr:hypothetical protein [Pseudomonadota bacterium]